jgi:hypothetical protein
VDIGHDKSDLKDILGQCGRHSFPLCAAVALSSAIRRWWDDTGSEEGRNRGRVRSSHAGKGVMRGDQGEQEQSSTVSAQTILGKTFKTIFRHVRATLCSDTFSSAFGIV